MSTYIPKWFKNTSSSIPKKFHFFFWIAYFTFNVIRWGSYFDDYWYSLKSNLVEFPLHLVVVYIHIYFLIPKFILKRKYKSYLFYLFLLFSLHYVVRTGLNYFLVTENIWPEAESSQEAFNFNHIIAVVLGEVYVVALATSIKLIFDWVYELNRVEELKGIQTKTELDFLKLQIQPHFFFNTLNNLYALTLEKSDAAPSVVLKLSDMMQYVLYEMKEPQIRMFTAITYIQNYFDLERLRYGSKLVSNMDIIGSMEDVNVPPLLFLPFIENCFKHGAKDSDKIVLDLSFENLENKWLIFKVENSLEEPKENKVKHGIGIKNVQRRLELLFDTNFELSTKIRNERFCVELKIPIQ